METYVCWGRKWLQIYFLCSTLKWKWKINFSSRNDQLLPYKDNMLGSFGSEEFQSSILIYIKLLKNNKFSQNGHLQEAWGRLLMPRLVNFIHQKWDNRVGAVWGSPGRCVGRLGLMWSQCFNWCGMLGCFISVLQGRLEERDNVYFRLSDALITCITNSTTAEAKYTGLIFRALSQQHPSDVLKISLLV